MNEHPVVNQLPYFFALLDKSKLIAAAVINKKLSDHDLAGVDYTRKDKNVVILRNFVLDKGDQFDEVFILISDFGVLIDFITYNTKYFENAAEYFNTRSVARRKRGSADETFRTKQINPLTVFSKAVHGAVMVSDLYGCKIMTGFYRTQP